MPVIFDFNELRGRIIAKYGDYKTFAEAINLSPAQLSGRLNNKVHFPPDEVILISSPAILDIPTNEIGRYFFSPKV